MSEIGNHINPTEVIDQWLLHPEKMDVTAIATIDRWLVEFPWFGTLHILKSIYAKNNGLSDYTHHLHRAAITTHDRSVLYRLMNDERSVEKNTSIPEEPIETENQKNIDLKDWVDIFLEEKPSEHITSSLADEWEDWSVTLMDGLEEEEPQVSFKNSEIENPVTVDVVVQDSTNDYPESPELSELGELGHDILNKAISSSIELEVSEKAFKDESSSQESKISETADYGDSFLNFIAASIGEPAEQPEHGKSIDGVQVNEQKKEDIIERFIQTEPQINRGKAIEYVAGNMAKESLEEDLNLVTETMAKLYVKQGKLDKARKAYKKLIELYPEKSIYFATQLKNLNKKN